MSKQLIHPYIDSNDYLKLKSRKINISELCRNLIKQYLEVDQENINDELELLSELEKEQTQVKQSNKIISELSTRLMIIKDNKKKEVQKKLDMEMRVNQGIKDSGLSPLDQ